MAEINIYYEKNPQYRIAYADGLIGGITPTGSINLNFYSTRQAIPKSIKHQLDSKGSIVMPGEASEDSKKGIIREIDFGLYLTRANAQEIYTLLGQILGEKDDK